MTPRRLALAVLLEVLLRADPCVGARKKASLAVTMTERLNKAKLGDADTIRLAEDLVREAQEGAERLDTVWACVDVQHGILGQLIDLDDQLIQLTNYNPLYWDVDSAEQVHNITSTLATAIMGADEKKCLKEAMADPDVQTYVGRLNSRRAGLFDHEAPGKSPGKLDQRAQRAFARLASWQEALVGLGASMVDRDELYPRDVSNIYDCPQPCKECTFKHNSMFKGDEFDKFKCFLEGKYKDMPPSAGNTKFSCDTSVRRTWKFWEFKTWCTVPGWVMDTYQNARIAAMVTCGTHSLLATLKADEVMSDDVMRACMLSEQGMVVTVPQLQAYQDFMAKEDDGEVPLGLQYAFGAFVTTATAQGLVALRDTATVTPPSDDNWEELLHGSGYTLLPPALVSSVPCKPPVSNWVIFMGAFAAVAAIGSAAMLGMLASIPLILLTGFFFLLALTVFVAGVQTGTAQLGFIFAYVGVLVASEIPKFFTNAFATVSSTVYNALVPGEQVKACPAGILFLSGSPPMCIEDMNKLEAKRYTCPQDESKTVVVSCEPAFNGVVAIRGDPC